MYSTTHLALGLIIGKISGDYPAALIGSLAIDIDHLIPAIKNKKSFNLKKFWNKTKDYKDSSRSYLHSLFSWFLISLIIFFFDSDFAIIFSIAYLGHFVLDALDNSSFYPFYPFKNFDIKGFIPYYSFRELVFSIFLFVIFLLI